MADHIIDRTSFFLVVRNNLYSGTLNQSQVEGMTAILDEWENDYDDLDDRFLAYMLATAYHETDKTMQAISEYGLGAGHPYGQPDPDTGQTYYGRGLVQLTWKANYQTFANLLGVDLVNHPELALDLATAVTIMFVGMIKGLFTGVNLGDYFNTTTADWVNARKIINGLDKAQLIAGHGQVFYSAISYMPAPVAAAPAAPTDQG